MSFAFDIPYTKFEFNELSRQINLDADFVSDVEYITEGWIYKCRYHYDQTKKILSFEKPISGLTYDSIRIKYESLSQSRDEKINQLL